MTKFLNVHELDEHITIEVLKVKPSDGGPAVVIKRVTSPQYDYILRKEYEFYRLLGSHPRICSGSRFSDSELVLDYYKKGDLLRWCGYLSEAWVKQLGRQIAEGLHYCHSKHICHGDVKPENVLLTIDFQPCLCDFGGSAVFASVDERLKIGFTRDYAAPEIDSNPTARCDYWAFGMLLYEMYTRELAFPVGDKRRELFKGFDSKFSLASRDLIETLLDQDPEMRYSFDDVLAHEFFE